MSFSQVLPEVQSLSRQDKIKLIRFIAQELEKDDGEIIEPNRDYPVWSPESAFSAAQTMLQVLKEEESR